MKKFLFLLLGSVLFMASQAQLRTMTSPGVMTNAVTAVVTTTTITGHKDVVVFVLTVTKGTGTVAGTAILQGSQDNTLFATVPGAATATLTDVATQNFAWVVAPSSFSYYRISVSTTGTQTSTPTGTCLIRKR